jgi:hypothetical protein
MPRSKDTSAIASHLWQHHGRMKSTGTLTERLLFHEEIHATGAPEDLDHEHGPDGEFVVRCVCGHEHDCRALSTERA